MNSKDIFMIVLLIVILAIVYKIMQSMKLQSELTIGIAKKAGVPIPKIEPNPFKRPRGLEQETEDVNHEEVDENEEQQEEGEEQDGEEEQEEGEEEGQEEENQEKETAKATQKTTTLKVVKPKKDSKKSKLKGYEMIAELLDTPMTAGQLKDKWKEEHGETPDAKIIYNLNYALSLDIVKKHPIGKRFLYANAEIFDGDVLKEEFLPQSENENEEEETNSETTTETNTEE